MGGQVCENVLLRKDVRKKNLNDSVGMKVQVILYTTALENSRQPKTGLPSSDGWFAERLQKGEDYTNYKKSCKWYRLCHVLHNLILTQHFCFYLDFVGCPVWSKQQVQSWYKQVDSRRTQSWTSWKRQSWAIILVSVWSSCQCKGVQRRPRWGNLEVGCKVSCGFYHFNE